MTYQALYRKWRPLVFADVIGQQHITSTLRNQIESNRLSHAYLFTGTRGTGKTTCAKILSRAVNCEKPVNGDPCNECASCKGILDGSVLDVTEIDAASNNGVDNIRELRDETRYTPAQVKKRVFIIDEVHMLSIGAFNALLKTLEEPPEHVLFILATTELNKVPATILSRCQRFDFRRISADDIAKRLLDVAQNEKIPLTDNAAKLIARLADGAMRDALSILDRAAAMGAVDEESVTSALGILGQDDAIKLTEHIKNSELGQAVRLLGEYYNEGRDLSGVLGQLLSLIRDALLVKTAKNKKDVAALLSPAYSITTLQKLIEGLAASTLISWSRIITESLDRMRNASNRRIEAELCMVRLCTLTAEDYDTLGGRVEALEEKVRNGITLKKPEAPDTSAQPLNNELPPPPGDGDAPGYIEEPGPHKDVLWPHWQKLLGALAEKINIGALMNLKVSAKGVLENGKLIILCEDPVTMKLASNEKTINEIRRQAEILNGAPINVKIRESDDKPKNNPKIDELRGRAKAFEIRVKDI